MPFLYKKNIFLSGFCYKYSLCHILILYSNYVPGNKNVSQIYNQQKSRKDIFNNNG